MNYKRIYFRIIRYRLANPLSGEEYGENHHIIPSSLGGSNDNCNLVRLSYREHFICHVLLYRIFKERAKNPVLREKDKRKNALMKMAYAFHAMSNGGNHHVNMGYKFRLCREYDKLKQEAISLMKKYSKKKVGEMFAYFEQHLFMNDDKQSYVLFQNRFQYHGTKSSLLKLFVAYGFRLSNKASEKSQKRTEYHVKKKLEILKKEGNSMLSIEIIKSMYDRYCQNVLKEKETYEEFAKATQYPHNEKRLRNLFSGLGLNVPKKKENNFEFVEQMYIDYMLNYHKQNKFDAFKRKYDYKGNKQSLRKFFNSYQLQLSAFEEKYPNLLIKKTPQNTFNTNTIQQNQQEQQLIAHHFDEKKHIYHNANNFKKLQENINLINTPLLKNNIQF